MKRIGIVTFFQSYNYGVWFQAYATQAFLRGRGYDAQIVNYSNLHDDEKLKMAFKGKNSMFVFRSVEQPKITRNIQA